MGRLQESSLLVVAFGLLAAGVTLVAVDVLGPDPAAEPPVAATPDHVPTRSPEVPFLPFDDNPDPSQCGIPVRWGSDEPAFLDGRYDGEMIQPDVALYDSHLRREVRGWAPHGTEVTVVLYQENPVLDYYLVEVKGSGVQGWVPAPLLSFEPPA